MAPEKQATTLLDPVKKALRVSHSALDTAEIVPLIEAALKDLASVGITAREDDALIARAVTSYAKAHFGYDNPEAERFERVYNSLKNQLSMMDEYTNGGGESG